MNELTPCSYTDFSDERMHGRVDYLIDRAATYVEDYELVMEHLHNCFQMEIDAG